MPHLTDGTIVDSNQGVRAPGSAARRQFGGMTNLQIGQVIATHPIDDQANHSKTQVEYDVLVSENRTGLVTYKGVRRSEDFGGVNNFNEVVLQDTPGGSSHMIRPGDLAIGSWVLIGCIAGFLNQAIILAEVQHPYLRKKVAVSPVPEFLGASESPSRDDDMVLLPTLLPGAKTEDGQRILGEFNGLRWHINKDGEFTVMMQGVKDAQGNLTNKKGGSIFKFDKTGRITIIDRQDQHITFSPDDGTVTISDGQAEPDSIILDRKGQSIIIRAKNDVILQEGKGKVLLGSRQASEPVVLGNQLDIFLRTFLQSLNIAFQALATASVGPLAGLKPGFTAAALACTTALDQIRPLLSKKALTE